MFSRASFFVVETPSLLAERLRIPRRARSPAKRLSQKRSIAHHAGSEVLGRPGFFTLDPGLRSISDPAWWADAGF